MRWGKRPRVGWHLAPEVLVMAGQTAVGRGQGAMCAAEAGGAALLLGPAWCTGTAQRNGGARRADPGRGADPAVPE